MFAKRGFNGHITYDFDVKVNATSSISKFWFTVDERDGSEHTLVDNFDGAGFVLDQEQFLFDPSRTGLMFNPMVMNIVTAPQITNASQTTNVTLTTWKASSFRTHPTIATRATLQMSADSRFSPELSYTFFSTNASVDVSWVDIEAHVGEETFRKANLRVFEID
ncbi:hypothetical protein AAF712_014913 [Marasmius tenuissimus]|uniref:Uncharacterized protein n=1 Tax=Marasmius tenuissimus TaxID=585030 RepID=A0ABR2ZAT1_9AGAR